MTTAIVGIRPLERAANYASKTNLELAAVLIHTGNSRATFTSSTGWGVHRETQSLPWDVDEADWILSRIVCLYLVEISRNAGAIHLTYDDNTGLVTGRPFDSKSHMGDTCIVFPPLAHYPVLNAIDKRTATQVDSIIELDELLAIVKCMHQACSAPRGDRRLVSMAVTDRAIILDDNDPGQGTVIRSFCAISSARSLTSLPLLAEDEGSLSL